MKKVLLNLAVLLLVNLLGFNVMAEETKVSFTLDEIVVTASKYEEKLSEAPVSIEVIDEEEIKQKNAKNTADLLRDIAGIDVNDYGGVVGSKNISIRGSSSKQVLILIDGVKMNNHQNGVFDLGQVSIEQIERIEVVRGAASALYGANAVGGVVNIITKSGSQEPETITNVGYGSFGSQTYDLIHRGKDERLGYNVSFSKRESDGHRENSELAQENIFTKFNYDLNNYSDLLLSLQYIDSDKGSPGSEVYPSSTAYQDDETMNLNVQWDRKTEDNDSKLAFYYNDQERIYENPDYNSYSKHQVDKIGVDFNQTLYYDYNKISYGGELVRENVESTDIKDGEQDSLNKALFIQDEWAITNPLKIIVSGRYDDHEGYEAEFSPRLGTVYTINSKLNLHASLGEAYRAPTFDELYGSYPGSSWSWYGNPDLDPETSKNYEVGMKYLDKRTKVELNLFKRDVEEMINGNYFDEDKGYSTAVNIDSAEISGIEVILVKYLTKKISTDLNYTYLDARDKKTDKRLASRDYHNLNLGLNYNTEEISGSLNGRLIAGRAEELPSYFVVDAKLNKKIKDSIEVSLEFNNLLDREYEVVNAYPMPERNYMLKISTKF
ncbi:outer membrane receptor for ferrienterochelin and colicins [Orenia metallireducens]|uniref:Outer membrane receptor for ferrienterochelin and colicins n=1 Tax=Orenia metallireducens TaxID=1413210 RepID=A0A285GZB9_9FIRM|nr:TonB-dependent receptor [Orenia metallireducens]PRX31101.1 outer membrane receptor for ferrienterochelin and colicins [Orenia metallireducens]SNY27591.1 outer membrane receptor for ferrienterochelin and colicins [Orenia metallireducens]